MSDYFSRLFQDNYKPKYGKGAFTLGRRVLFKSGVLDALERIPNDGTKEIIEKIVSDFEKDRIKSTVVIGSGSGKMGSNLRYHYKDTKIYDIDKEPAVIDRLKRKCSKDSLRLPLLADAQSLPFKDGSFDLVVAYSVLRYIKNTNLVIKEIYRILKKGGVAVVVEARIKKVIDSVEDFLKNKEISFKRYTQNKVSFTRVSFFYYLISESGKNSFLRRKIEEKRKILNCSFAEAAVQCAGSYYGSLYFILFEKDK